MIGLKKCKNINNKFQICVSWILIRNDYTGKASPKFSCVSQFKFDKLI